MTLESNVARLARTRPFNLLPREALQLIAFSCGRRHLQAGEVLFRADEVGEEGYFLHSGVVVLSKKGVGTEDERRVRAGAFIGETALYAPVKRQVGARVAEDAVVTPVPRETFRRVLTEFPAAAEKVRAALAQRSQRLVEGLDASRARSLDAPRPNVKAAR